MDTSFQYMKMCKEAPEIQDFKKIMGYFDERVIEDEILKLKLEFKNISLDAIIEVLR